MDFQKPKEIKRPRVYIIVLRKKGEIRIPTSSQYLLDIDPKIIDILTVKRSYRVQSKVSIDVLKSFINNWIYQTIPDINSKNFNEFELLSQEFDRMKDIIELYRPALDSIQIKEENKKRIDSVDIVLQKLIKKYQSNIHLLFKYSHFDLPNFTFVNLKDKFYYYDDNDNNLDIILLNIMQKVEIDRIEYAINEYDKTAIAIKSNSYCDIYIPRQIEYGSEKFKVASIQNFQCKEECNLHFYSNIRIPKNSLNCYKIKKISFPSSIEEIEEGFCTNRSNIKFDIYDVKNEPKNVLYASGVYSTKSDPTSDSFDILLTPGQIEYSQSPERFIKRIASYAFIENDLSNGLRLNYCTQLESIGICSFLRCKMTNITFPASLIVIEREAFRYTSLKRITFPYDSKLKEIGDFGFANCDLTRIELPSSLVKTGYGCFSFNEIESVRFDDNSKLEEIGDDSFGLTKLKNFKVPKNVKKIGNLAFSDIDPFTELEITSNKLPEVGRDIYFKSIEQFVIPSDLLITSKDKRWNKYIFQSKNIKIKPKKEVNIKYFQDFIVGKQDNSDKNDDFCILYYATKRINKVEIPSFVKIINSNCFSSCESLTKITVENDSKLSVIKDFAFSNSPIEELSIPSNICLFEEYCFNGTNKLININIIPAKEQNIIYYDNSILIGKSNNNDNEYDTIHFVRRDLKKITIPSFVKKISSSSFNCCKKLQEINFEKDSKLELINENQFNNLNIRSIKIPKKVISISKFAFANCNHLNFVEFDEDSNLSSIYDEAFIGTSLKCLKIPSSVSKIKSYAFTQCNSIEIVEIGENSKLESINLSIYNNRSQILLMVPIKLSHRVKL